MQKFLIVMFFSIFAHAHASELHLEFDPAEEVKCHQEAKSLKCTNSKDEENEMCLEARKEKLSPACRKMHAEKKAKG